LGDIINMKIPTILNFLVYGFILTSIFSITATNSVISVIFLITTFVQVAIYLILIGINFIAISYIVIYVGAIAVLFLFIIMMINIKQADVLETGNTYTKNLPLAINIAIYFIFILFTLLPLNINTLPFGASISFPVSYELSNSLTLTREVDNLFSLSSYTKDLLKTYNSDTLLSNFTQIEVLGHNLYTNGAILLIVLSLILLLAMLSTIVLSKYKTNKNI